MLVSLSITIFSFSMKFLFLIHHLQVCPRISGYLQKIQDFSLRTTLKISETSGQCPGLLSTAVSIEQNVLSRDA